MKNTCFVFKEFNSVFDGIPRVIGKICWQTLQSDQVGPCPFCTNAEKLLLSKGVEIEKINTEQATDNAE